MRRSSSDQVDFDSGGPLTDKWVIKDPPQKPTSPTKVLTVDTSYVKFEDLNELGHFSFNAYNKDIEVHTSKKLKREYIMVMGRLTLFVLCILCFGE